MGSLAQKFIDEGEKRGINKGISIGKQEGISMGVQQTAIKMLKMKTDVKFISSVTGLTITQITKLKNSM